MVIQIKAMARVTSPVLAIAIVSPQQAVIALADQITYVDVWRGEGGDPRAAAPLLCRGMDRFIGEGTIWSYARSCLSGSSTTHSRRNGQTFVKAPAQA
jgi:hypothetical protein